MEFGVSQRARGKKVWGFSSSDPGRATHRGVVEEPGERVRDGLRLVVVHHRRQVAPARVSADLDHPGAQHDPESQPAQRPHRGPRRRHPCRHCVDAQHRDLSHSGARAFSAGPPRVVRRPASGRARSGCGRERDAARQWTERGLARLARGAGAGRGATRSLKGVKANGSTSCASAGLESAERRAPDAASSARGSGLGQDSEPFADQDAAGPRREPPCEGGAGAGAAPPARITSVKTPSVFWDLAGGDAPSHSRSGPPVTPDHPGT